MRRVVVTGLGMVSPFGSGVDTAWKSLLESKSAIRKIENIDLKDIPCQIAGQVILGEGEGEFDPCTTMVKKDHKKHDKFILFGLAAADEAIADSGWKAETEEEQFRTGVMIGSGIGGLEAIYNSSVNFHENGCKKISPFFIPSCLINLVSGNLSIKYGFKGPNHACVTACSTGTHAIGDASRIIAHGDADVMIAGGAESGVNAISLAGFSRARAVTTDYNDNPEAGSRPWDQGRSGFVMGEGAGVVVLEEYEHAKARGAKIYGEVVGYGMSGDAYHITAPASDGNGAFRSMQAALKNSGLSVDDIDYVNAHGTSTPLGDTIEAGAVKRLLGSAMDNVSMSSTKSAVGHLLGAAGAVEAIFSIKAMDDQVVPPTLNLDNPDEAVEGLDLVPHKAKEREVRAAMSNSFGFGGTNSTLIFKKI